MSSVKIAGTTPTITSPATEKHSNGNSPSGSRVISLYAGQVISNLIANLSKERIPAWTVLAARAQSLTRSSRPLLMRLSMGHPVSPNLYVRESNAYRDSWSQRPYGPHADRSRFG